MLIAGDIGGTKVLLALTGKDGAVFERRYRSHDFSDFEALLARFLDETRSAVPGEPSCDSACFGFAGPIEGERVRLTNLPWIVDASGLRARFNFRRVMLINDFEAAAWGVRHLEAHGFETLQAGEPVASAPRVVLGAGTGLGIGYLAAGARPVAGEGGHTAFAPATDEQVMLWRHLHSRFGRVTLEHVISGAGLLRIYEFLRERGTPPESAKLRTAFRQSDPAAAISRFAIEHADPLAGAALDLFLACYGAAAGDHALNVMARGGVFIAGGIAPKILPRLRAGGFLGAFNDKGEFSAHTRRMPVHVVTDERLGLMGAAAAGRHHAG